MKIDKYLRKSLTIFTLCLACMSSLSANNSFASEASHVGGGMLIAGMTTGIVDRYFPQYREERAWIGFWTDAAIAAVLFGIETAQDRDDVSGELLDLGCNLVGGAIGAYTTDRFFLAPVVHKAPDGSHDFGIKAIHRF